MTTKERLLQELESAPEALLEATLQFVLTNKIRESEESKGSGNSIDQTVSSDQPTGIAALIALAEQFAAEMTEEELAQLPSDGALEHDHYIYGTPKRYANEANP